MLALVKKLIIKILNLKLVILLESQNMKILLQKDTLVIKKVKNAVPWTYVINDLSGNEIVGTFCEN